MAIVTIDLGDATQTARILDAFAGRFGWTAESGVTKAAFGKQRLIRFIKETVQAYESDAAAQAARIAAESSVNPT